MEMIYKRTFFVIIAVLVLVSTFSLSQFNQKNVMMSETLNVKLGHENPILTVSSMFLKLDDEIKIIVSQNNTQLNSSVHVSFIGRPSVSSSESVNPSLVWICNGNQNYTIDLKITDSTSFQTADFSVNYTVLRGVYPYVLLFPFGLIIGSIILFVALDSKCFIPKTCFSSVISSKSFFSLPDRILSRFFGLFKSFDKLALLLFFIFFVFSLFFTGSMLHNDEIGGGKIGDWGYFAWGYVDTNEQIVDLFETNTFDYVSWHSLQTMNKSPFANYLMAIFVVILRNFDSVMASRLFVQFLAALTPVIIYCLISTIFDRTKGCMGAFLLFFNPIYLNYAQSSYLEIPLLFFLSTFLLVLHKTSVTNNRFYVYVSGLILGLILSTKSFLFLYLLIPLTFLWLYFFTPKSVRSFGTILFMIFKICFISVVIFLLLWPAMWVNPFLKLIFHGAFFGFFGSYGPLFSVTYPTLFLGVTTSIAPLTHALTLLFYQSTYVELLGFCFGIAFLLYYIKSKNNLSILIFFGLNLFSLAFLYSYQHHLLYFILSFSIVAGLGYGYIIDAISHMIKNYGPNLFKVSKYFSNFSLLLIVTSQLFLIVPFYPYYGLYYNNAFLGEKQSTEVFRLPEPVYGLDQVADYLYNNPPSSKIVLTTNAPHTLQAYLPDYVVKSTYAYSFDDNDAKNLMILRSLGIEYVVIGVYSLQINSSFHLKNTLDKNSQLYICKHDDVALAYLYHIPPISWNNTVWENNFDTSQSWQNNSNSDSCSYTILPDGQLEIDINFNSSYPPSLWFKIYQKFSTTIDLSNSSLYFIPRCFSASNVTISLTLVDSNSNHVETVLKKYNVVENGEIVFFTKVIDLIPHDKYLDPSEITRFDLTFYNLDKTTETILLQKFSFVN